MAEWLLAASMDIDPANEDVFNTVYEEDHIPTLLAVPGVRSISRVRREDEARIYLGGEPTTFRFPGEPRYTAIYELESPAVLTTREWAEAVDVGRWSREVRPYTMNRRHLLLRVISKR